MKKYESAKIELISVSTTDIILMSPISSSGPTVFGSGAIDGELDFADEVTR